MSDAVAGKGATAGDASDDPARSARLAVLISGGGTTLRNLLELRARGAFAPSIELVISSAPDARGLDFARTAGISTVVARKTRELDDEAYSRQVFDPCRELRIDWVVMGGFLKHVRIPDDFAGRVVNIHPSLIPAFSGHGMYGLKVHQAVLDYGAVLTGCTVHLVDDDYDRGPILAQRCVPVLPDDDAATLQRRVFREECRLYPETLEKLVRGSLRVEGRRVRSSLGQSSSIREA